MISAPDGRSANFFSFRSCDVQFLQQSETPHWPQNFIVSPTSVGKHVKFLLVRHNLVRKFKIVVKLLDSIQCEATANFQSFYVNRIILQVSRFDKWNIFPLRESTSIFLIRSQSQHSSTFCFTPFLFFSLWKVVFISFHTCS